MNATPARDERKRRGRILRMKFGYNPNSSSLAMDVSLLLLGASLVGMLGVFVASVVRLRIRRPPADGAVDSRGKGGADAV
ncbi:MAG: hypothetical protein KC466_10625 [Myxococcales bacterium]|nr:hypothetical protein [Myxococcales bacterium]